jgi:threonylcarbamoyladenosine tRNA methylthiotransferase MtaB
VRSVKEERVACLRALGQQKKENFYSRFIKERRPVMVEGKRSEEGLLKGFTDNYIPVSFSGEDLLINSVVLVELEENNGTNVSGKYIQGTHEG